MSWTKAALVEFLNRKNIPARSYSFYEDKDEAFCMVRVDDEWLIYYSERGKRNELGWAKNESQALDLLKLFLLEAYRAF